MLYRCLSPLPYPVAHEGSALGAVVACPDAHQSKGADLPVGHGGNQAEGPAENPVSGVESYCRDPTEDDGIRPWGVDGIRPSEAGPREVGGIPPWEIGGDWPWGLHHQV